MAIIQRSYPDDFRPAYNEIEFSFSSDNYTQCDFEFIADLYVNGSFATRLKAFPEGDNNYGYFRIEEILQDYLSYNFHQELVGFAQNKQCICSYYLEIRERYNSSSTCVGSSTLSSVLLTTGTRYAFNAALSYKDFAVYDQDNYLCTDSTSKFLTNSPDRIIIPLDGDFNLSFLQDPDNPVEDIEIKTYDRFDNLLGTYRIDNTFNLSSPDVPEDYHLSVGVGPEQLNDSTLSSGVQPVYHSNVHYYTVQLRDSDSPANYISELKTFEIDSRCTNYDPYRLWWWNRAGGWDAYSFPLRFTRNVNINKTFIEKTLPTGYELGDRGERVISVDAQEAHVYQSNWLSYEEGVWLRELFTSPEVFVFVPESSNSVEYEIEGVVHRASNQTADFALSTLDGLDIGTTFIYEVSDGSLIGMASTGTGTITGFDHGNSRILTDVSSTINAGAIITGSLLATLVDTPAYRLPIVVTTPSYEEKTRSIRYSVEARPSYKENIQRQ